MATRPPDRLTLRDVDGRDLDVLLGPDGLILKRGMIRFDLPPEAGLHLLRWLLWHDLHGLWAPKPKPVAYPRDYERQRRGRGEDVPT